MVHADGASLQAHQQLLALGSAHQLQVQGVTAQEVHKAGWQLASWVVKVSTIFRGKQFIKIMKMGNFSPGCPPWGPGGGEILLGACLLSPDICSRISCSVGALEGSEAGSGEGRTTPGPNGGPW